MRLFQALCGHILPSFAEYLITPAPSHDQSSAAHQDAFIAPALPKRIDSHLLVSAENCLWEGTWPFFGNVFGHPKSSKLSVRKVLI